MFQRVLLAVDGTETGHVAACYAGALARSTNAGVRILYVNELMTGRGVTRCTNREAGEVVSTAMRALADAGSATDGVVKVATRRQVASTISRVAAEWGADVIVLGCRRRKRVGRLSGAGVAGRLAALTHLATLTAPPPLDVRRLDSWAVDLLPSLAGRGGP